MASAWSIVARTEYAEGVRSRWFIGTTLLVPVLFIGSAAVSAAVEMHAGEKTAHIALVDQSDPPIGDVVRTALEGEEKGKGHYQVDLVSSTDAEPAALQARIDSGDLDGCLTLPPEIAHGGHARYRGTNASSPIEVGRLSSALRGAVIAGRAKALGLKGGDLGVLLAEVSLDAEQSNGTGGKASGGASFAAAYFAALALYMCIVLYGVTVARAVVQEKTSRIIELLVACVRPWDLMVGKILGAGTLGLTQIGIWMSAAFFVARFRGPILERFGVHGAERLELPQFGLGEVAIIVIYFLGGFFLYATLYAAAGAASNSEREAQQTQMPLTIPLIGAVMCFPAVTTNPRGSVAVALTLIPFFSPVLMPMRYLLTPLPLWQLLVSMALLFATIAGAAWLGARIYRVGILMYGKKPSFGELLRWIRTD